MWGGSHCKRVFGVFAVAQSDFLPEYFSLTEKPPEEFCLSPDASSSSSHIAVDLTPKRGTAHIRRRIAMETQPRRYDQTCSVCQFSRKQTHQAKC